MRNTYDELKREKTTKEIELSYEESIKTLEEKYLRLLEVDTIRDTKMKDIVKKK